MTFNFVPTDNNKPYKLGNSTIYNFRDAENKFDVNVKYPSDLDPVTIDDVMFTIHQLNDKLQPIGHLGTCNFVMHGTPLYAINPPKDVLDLDASYDLAVAIMRMIHKFMPEVQGL